MSTPSGPPPIYFTFLNRLDLEELAITSREILDAIEASLAAQGRGETVIEPRTHLDAKAGVDGHFNVLRGAIRGDIDSAGVKVVSDYVDNWKHGYTSELGVLLLFDPRVGRLKAMIEASEITDMRTGAVSALGAKYLAPRKAKVLGNVGARGSSYWNCRLIAELFELDEIRIHSKRPESRNALVERLRRELGNKVSVRATDDWRSCVEGADIVIDAARLVKPEPLLKTEWIRKGALVMPYGTMSAVELSLTEIMDKFVMDDWGQARAGTKGALRAHVDKGLISEKNLHAELGEIVAGLKPGREREDETIVFWHRGLSLSDIALGHAMLKKAERLGIGQRLRFA